MKFDLDKVILVRSEYHQYHGEGTYHNQFALDVERALKSEPKPYLEFCERNSLLSGTARIEFHHNKEVRVKVVPNVRGRHVYYFHEFRGLNGEYDPNVGYIALFAVEDALAGVGRAERITLVLPHIPYLRGDWNPESRVPIMAKSLATLTETGSLGKLSHVISLDFHSPQEVAFYNYQRPDDLPFRPVIALSLIHI